MTDRDHKSFEGPEYLDASAASNWGTQFKPQSYDAQNHTVDLLISAGNRVPRWYGFLELNISPEAMDLSRVDTGKVHLFDSHNSDSIRAIAGNVIGVRHEGGMPIAKVKFAATELGQLAEGMVSRGELTGASPGFYITERQKISPEDVSPPVYRANKWQLLELSLTGIPADGAAGTLSVERPGTMAAQAPQQEVPKMADPTTAAATTTAAITPDPEALRAAQTETLTKERTRVKTIRERTKAAGLPVEEADKLIDEGIAIEHVGDRLVDAMAARGGPARLPAGTAGHTPANGLDAMTTRNEGIVEALLHRGLPDRFKMTDRAREFYGWRVTEIGRELLEASGKRMRGKSDMEITRLALESTSDLPALLANVANKSLQMGYAAEPRTFQPFCTQRNLPDFKTTSSVLLSEGSNLEKINEAGEFRRGSVTDSKEQWNLVTYGKILGFTRQAMMNDDLQGLTRIPYNLGQAGVRIENDVVWAILTANANMSDGIALFQAGTHKNTQTGGGSALAVASIGTMRKQMRVQKGPDGNQTLNLLMKFIMVPAALETTLDQLITSALYPATPGNAIPGFVRTLTPIIEARLDANSATRWYGACDPGVNATIEYGYLQGQEGMSFETRLGFDVDGVEIKVRHDFGAKAVNWRGLQNSDGA